MYLVVRSFGDDSAVGGMYSYAICIAISKRGLVSVHSAIARNKKAYPYKGHARKSIDLQAQGFVDV